MNQAARDARFLAGFSLLALMYVGHRDFGLFRVRLVLAAMVGLLLVVLWVRRRDWLSGSGLGVSLGLAAVSVGLAFVAASQSGDPLLYALGPNLAVVALGWALVIALPAAGSPAGGAGRPDDDGGTRDALAASPAWWTRTPSIVVGLAVAASILAVFHWLARGARADIIDEILYVLQGRLMFAPGFSQAIDPSLEPFFAIKYTVLSGGRLYTQYPPGWPLLLAAFDAVGLRWWANVVLGVVTVVLTGWIGARVWSRKAGVIAGALLATAPWFVGLTSSYFAHTAATATVCAAAAALLEGERREGRRRVVWWLVAGALLGFLTTIRPLTGATLGLSLVLWIVARRRVSLRQVPALLALLAIGTVPAAAGLLHYNARTTGDPFLFGYEVTNGEYGALGFGERGEIRYDAQGQPFVRAAAFTPRDALRNLTQRIWDFARDLPQIALLLPILALALRAGFRIRGSVVAAFLVLPAVHFFYYWTSIRFYTELLPFVIVGLAGIFAHLLRERAIAGRRLVIFVALMNLLFLPATLRFQWSSYREVSPYFEAVEAERQDRGRILVFVRPSEEEPRFFWRLYWYNAVGFFGDVIVARDLGERNVDLTRRFPEHAAFRMEWQGADPAGNATLLTPLGTASPALPLSGLDPGDD